MKRCTQCGKVKKLGEFTRDKQLRSGITSRCKTCSSEYQRKYQEQNRERVAAQKREYYKRNRADFLERARTRVTAMSESQRALLVAYKAAHNIHHRQKNVGRMREQQRIYAAILEGKVSRARIDARRRQRISQAPVTLTAGEWLELLEQQNYACAYCGKPFSVDLKATRDHIIPVLHGGGLTRENVLPACQSCNSSKGAKLIA